MGSTGTGKFSDYSGAKNTTTSGNGPGGTSGQDRCKQSFSCVLEEVAQCDFYSKHSRLPEIESTLRIVLKKRLLAINDANETVGALPTEFNYLAGCIEAGINYAGVITHCISGKVPSIHADFTPV